MNETTNTNGVIAQKTKTNVSKDQKVELLKFKEYIKAYEKEIARALPSIMTPERFTRIAMTAVTQNEKLAECTPQSFIGAMLTSAQLGLEPNTPLGQAYLIPYGKQCQFQIGYKGLIDLAHRSGEVQCIDAHCVYENDEFDFELGLEPKLKHKPAKTNRGELVWVYATYRLKNGGYAFEVMSKEDVETHAKTYSKAFSNGPWKTNFEEMAKKTVLKKVLKYAPLKTDYVKGVVDDGKSFDIEIEDGEIKTINNDVEVIDVE